MFLLCSLLNDRNYFWNKYCHLPLLAICLLPLLIFLASCWYQKAKIGLRMSLQNKKLINHHIKGLYKTTCYKTKSNFPQFFFSHWLMHKCFFSFLVKVFENFEKLIRFHWQAFIVYKNGENLKMLIEIFCQKSIVSNVILAFLDHLKPKIFWSVDIEHHPFSKSLDPPLNSLGLVVSRKTKMLGLSVPQEDIFQFHLRIALSFKWTNYQIGIYFCEIDYIFRLPKDCISAYNLILKRILSD